MRLWKLVPLTVFLVPQGASASVFKSMMNHADATLSSNSCNGTLGGGGNLRETNGGAKLLCQGKVHVPTIINQGSRSNYLVFRTGGSVNRDGGVSGKTRVEYANGNYDFGESFFVGFRVRIASQVTKSTSHFILQVWQPNTSGHVNNPVGGLRVTPNTNKKAHFFTKGNNAGTTAMNHQAITQDIWLGRWTELLMKVHLDCSNGKMKVWKNGAVIANETDLHFGWSDAAQKFKIRWGSYQAPKKFEVHYDELVFANTRTEASPW